MLGNGVPEDSGPTDCARAAGYLQGIKMLAKILIHESLKGHRFGVWSSLGKCLQTSIYLLGSVSVARHRDSTLCSYDF
jgi:hypothetical protein